MRSLSDRGAVPIPAQRLRQQPPVTAIPGGVVWVRPTPVGAATRRYGTRPGDRRPQPCAESGARGRISSSFARADYTGGAPTVDQHPGDPRLLQNWGSSPRPDSFRVVHPTDSIRSRTLVQFSRRSLKIS